jgi:anti-sigma B factor antagonist
MTATQSLKMNVQKVPTIDRCVVIHPVGQIDIYNTESFRKQVLQVMDEGYCRLVFDMAEVPFMSSTPVGTCTIFLKEAKTRKGNIAMVNLQPRVREVIQLLGFTLYLNVMDSMAEALEFISVTSEAAQMFPKIFDCPVCGYRMRAGKNGCYRCSECKTILKIDEAGNARPVYTPEDNDYELVPEKTEKAIRLLGELACLVRMSDFGQDEKAAFKKTLGQVVLNLYQREVKDVWAELEEVRN